MLKVIATKENCCKSTQRNYYIYYESITEKLSIINNFSVEKKKFGVYDDHNFGATL